VTGLNWSETKWKPFRLQWLLPPGPSTPACEPFPIQRHRQNSYWEDQIRNKN
jgi:hypothetical protein